MHVKTFEELSFRDKAYKENPYITMMTDFLIQHEIKLKKLYKIFKDETGSDIQFLGFVEWIYNNAQDLVFDPSNN